MSGRKSTKDDPVARIRSFNRYYTRLLGLFRSRYLGSPVGYVQARVLYELNRRTELRAADLGRELGLDRGFLSRLLAGLEKKGLIVKKPDPKDRRALLLCLTRKGKNLAGLVDRHSDQSVVALLEGLSNKERADLIRAMDRIREILGEAGSKPP